MVPGPCRHRLPDPGARLEAGGRENYNALRTANHVGMLQGAREVQVVGRAGLDPDPHPRLIDVGGALHRRRLGHHVDTLDHDVGRREGPLSGSRGVDGEETQVRPALGHGVERDAGRLEAEQLKSHAQARGDLASDVNGDAPGSCGVPCARTGLPRLIEARSTPAGARSATTSEDGKVPRPAGGVVTRATLRPGAPTLVGCRS